MIWTLLPLCLVFSNYYAVFATRTEIKVWQDYHLRNLLTQISISRGCKQFISSYIKLHVVEKCFHSCWSG